MITLTLFLVVYLASAIAAYILVRRSHRAGGEFENISPIGLDILCVIVPGINSIIAIIEISKQQFAGRTLSERFFRIKK